MLVEDLLAEGYEYVMIGRFQSDPLERRFSQYRQMSGGRFLVSLREVISLERILACRSLLQEDLNFWEEDLNPSETCSHDENVLHDLESHSVEIQESALDNDSWEVSNLIAGYIRKKLEKKTKCSTCKPQFIATEKDILNDNYLKSLSRRELFLPSPKLAYFTETCFAILDYVWKTSKKEKLLMVVGFRQEY